MIRRAAVGAAVLAGLLLFSPTAAKAAPTVVRPGGLFTVHSTGFAPYSHVQMLLMPVKLEYAAHADKHGVVNVKFRAPITPGHYTMYVAGPPPLAEPRRTVLPPEAPQRQSDPIRVVVPKLVAIRFEVRGTSPGGHGTGHGRGHRPSATGVPARDGLVVAIVLVLAGTVLVLIARRRRPGRQPQQTVTGSSSSP